MTRHNKNDNRTAMAREPANTNYESFLPAEKSLMLWSLGLGAALMIVLVWVSYTYFPSG